MNTGTVSGGPVTFCVGAALGLGPHWYYNLEQMRKDYGSWIDGYTDPKPGRYHIWRAANDPDVNIEPAWKVSLVYGMPCSIVCMLPAAYCLAARYQDDFEQAVLHAVNGGGQNMSRAMLTGALVGAQVGLSGIPRRFVDGLSDSGAILGLAEKVAADAAA